MPDAIANPEERRSFASTLQRMRSLDRFMPAAEEHVAFLQRKAQRLEDYLRQG